MYILESGNEEIKGNWLEKSKKDVDKREKVYFKCVYLIILHDWICT